MQKRTKIILATAAAGLLATAVVGGAIAENKKHGMGHGMGMGDGKHHGRHHGMRHRIKHFAKRYDADKDGKISQQEVDTNRSDWHKKFDADDNGSLSLKEFESLWLQYKRQRMIRAFQRLDADGDAAMTLDEYKEPLAGIVERWDRNGDGVLSREDRKRRRHGMKMPMSGQEQGSTNSQ